MLPSTTFRFGALFTAVGIGATAYQTHGLALASPAYSTTSLQLWSNATTFLLINGVSLLALSPQGATSKNKNRGLTAILIGTAVYASTVIPYVLSREGWKWLEPITPLSGITMITGYVLLALS